jgi:hypothetical protein
MRREQTRITSELNHATERLGFPSFFVAPSAAV